MKTKPKPASNRHFDIEITAPKPNPMFNEWQTAITKFIRYTQAVKCAYCGRKSKLHWTQLKFFRIAVESQSFILSVGTELFPPLTPVCTKHILAPQEE